MNASGAYCVQWRRCCVYLGALRPAADAGGERSGSQTEYHGTVTLHVLQLWYRACTASCPPRAGAWCCTLVAPPAQSCTNCGSWKVHQRRSPTASLHSGQCPVQALRPTRCCGCAPFLPHQGGGLPTISSPSTLINLRTTAAPRAASRCKARRALVRSCSCAHTIEGLEHSIMASCCSRTTVRWPLE